jgi:cytochrome b subunit of formate dehydrogenase
MFKKFRERFQKLEFSQKLCIWVLTIYSLFVFGIVGLFIFVNQQLPVVEILNATIAIPVIEIGAFSGKTAVENVQKIIKAKVESAIGINSSGDSTNTPV